MATLTKTDVENLLRQVVDPELGVNIVDLGLIYGIDITEGNVTVTMTLTTPGCPLHEAMITGVEETLRRHPAVTYMCKSFGRRRGRRKECRKRRNGNWGSGKDSLPQQVKAPGNSRGQRGLSVFSFDPERLASPSTGHLAYQSTNPGEPGGACRMVSKIGRP